jgi:hypothetical protein
MTQNNEKKITVNGKNYVVKVPPSKVLQQGTKIYSIEFTKCLQDGLMTKAKMKDFLMEHGVWTQAQEEKEKSIGKEINQLELEIYKGTPGQKRNLKEGREKALKIKELRNEYIVLITERQSYEANTAEAIADNVRFDYLVSESIFNEDGTKVYSSFEDYQSRSSEDLAYEGASALAQIMYSLEDDFAKKLPENKFLATFGLVDEKLRLIDKDGNLVDRDFRKISEDGYYLDQDGNRVDRNGNKLNEDGTLDLEAVYLDDDGNEINIAAPTKKDKKASRENCMASFILTRWLNRARFGLKTQNPPVSNAGIIHIL